MLSKTQKRYPQQAEDKLKDNPKIFSCWRSHANSHANCMWPADDLVSGGMWPESSPNGGRCTRPRLVPAFGSAAVMSFMACACLKQHSTLQARSRL
jgi:hypothetical protein